METLRQKQSRFVLSVAKLINKAKELGYDLTFGECWRTPEQAAINAKIGKGIKRSLHTDRLAIDFNLYKDGVWLTRSEDHKPLGDYWKTLGEDHCWGGDFSKPDGNHYSITHNGIK